MPPVTIIRHSITRKNLKEYLLPTLGMVKAVVDIERNIMSVGAEMHVDEEQMLLADGSKQNDLWGINLYPERNGDDWIEFDSMINLRPMDDNRSRGVEDSDRRKKIRDVVASLIPT